MSISRLFRPTREHPPMSARSDVEISMVVNGHREGRLIYPTLRSVLRTVRFARDCNLKVELLVVLDRPDPDTMSIVARELGEDGTAHHVDFGDLALARNHGANQARGRYVAFMDGDDLCCRSWLVDALVVARAEEREVVLHPEYSVYFGYPDAHVLHHVDMESPDFEPEHFLKQNYWTALSFAERRTFLEVPYQRLSLDTGFGYEDWTWNHETMRRGIVHRVVPTAAHYIRRGKHESSLLDLTNSRKTVPTMLDVYRLPPLAA